jgi:hypothetical protein
MPLQGPEVDVPERVHEIAQVHGAPRVIAREGGYRVPSGLGCLVQQTRVLSSLRKFTQGIAQVVQVPGAFRAVGRSDGESVPLRLHGLLEHLRIPSQPVHFAQRVP